MIIFIIQKFNIHIESNEMCNQTTAILLKFALLRFLVLEYIYYF